MDVVLLIISFCVLVYGLVSTSITRVATLKQHPFLWWLLFTCITLGLGIITLPVAFRLRGLKKAEDLEAIKLRLTTEAKVFIDGVKAARALPTIMTRGALLLDMDEHCIMTEVVSLRETRAVRHSGGGYGSMRVGRYRVGSYSGTSTSSQEWTTLDQGSLFLTNKKLVFVGNKESRNLLLKHIVAIKTYLDAISITLDTRSKPIQFPVKNPYIWSTSINIAKSVENPFHLGELSLNMKSQ